MEVLGVLRRSGITVSTNATPEKKPLKSFDPCPQQKRSPHALHDSYLLERQRWRQADLLHNGMHTLVFILPFQLKRVGGSFAIFHQNVDVFCLHNVAGPPPQWSKDDHATVEYTHSAIPWKEEVFKMALVLLPWGDVLVVSVGVLQIETTGALVGHITPQHETRNNVSIHSFQRGCCNLYGGVGLLFWLQLLYPRQQGWSSLLIQGCFILNFRC